LINVKQVPAKNVPTMSVLSVGMAIRLPVVQMDRLCVLLFARMEPFMMEILAFAPWVLTQTSKCVSLALILTA
jgi:hypothetical protein